MATIVFDPQILGGKAVIKGTRISVDFILELLSSGMDIQNILHEYPHLKKADVLEAVSYAAKAIRHENIIVLNKPIKSPLIK